MLEVDPEVFIHSPPKPVTKYLLFFKGIITEGIHTMMVCSDGKAINNETLEAKWRGFFTMYSTTISTSMRQGHSKATEFTYRIALV